MSSRLTRRDIKRDEVLETISGFVGFVSAHGKAILLGVVGLIVVALGAAGYRAIAESKAAKGNSALGRALLVYGAPIDAESPQPDDPSEPRFADEASRTARAKRLFADIAERFSATDAGDIAGAYLGSIAAAEGDLETARDHWQRFVERQQDHLLALEVRLNLMSLDSALGRGEELVDELRAELSSADSDLPEEVLLHQLGLTLESLGRTEEAADIYRRLVQDFPFSAYSDGANKRLTAIEAAAGNA